MSATASSACKPIVQQSAAAASNASPDKVSTLSFGVNPLTGRADIQNVASTSDIEGFVTRMLQAITAGDAIEETEVVSEANPNIYRFKQDQMIKDWKLNIPKQPAGLSYCFEELSIECPRKLNRVQIREVMETALLSVWQLHFQGKENMYDRFKRLREWGVAFRASGDTGNRKLPVTYPECFNLE